MKTSYSIGYDLGSSFLNDALTETKTGKKIKLIKEPSEEMDIISPQSGWAEQDPKLWWKYICLGTKRIIKETKINSKQIVSVGISYQMHGLVLIDKKGNIKHFPKNKKSFIANKIAQILLDKLLDDRNFN